MEGENEKVENEKEASMEISSAGLGETSVKPEHVYVEPEETIVESGEDLVEPEEIEEEYDDENWEAEVGGSEATPLGGLYGLFKEVAKQRDTKRVSNLTKEELGIWNLSVRDCERVALIADTFHHSGVAEFFRRQSRIVTDTAMSKNGWFTELFITSKRFASRGSTVSNLPQSKKSKWRIFSDKGGQPIQEPV